MARKRKLNSAELKPMQLRRMLLLGCLLICCFCALGYRLFLLQVVRQEHLAELARNNTQRTFLREPRRGDIRDRHGNLLATSKSVKTVFVDPSILGDFYPFAAQALAPILDLPQESLAEKMRPRVISNSQGKTNELKYAVLKRKVEEEDWQRITNTMAHLSFGIDESKLKPKDRRELQRIRQRAIGSEPDHVRFYPNGTLAAHILGYVGMITRTNMETRVVETSGQDGLELTLNSMLTGVRGWRMTELDSRSREIIPFREQDVAPRSGLHAMLTLDSGIQHIVESELAAAMERHTPISISAVVLRPNTGEILGMANLPTFDPNRPGDSDVSHLRNRMITDLAEPGSTFKIVVVSAGLNEGEFRLTDQIFCENGRYLYAGRYLHDHGRHGILSVEGIIAKSSNIGSAKIGIRLGPERLYHYVRAFGFGQKTGIPLPGEVSGIAHPLKNWNKLSISRIPMGHEIASTPLQMAIAMSAIANGGVLMKPMLIDRFVDDNGQVMAKYNPEPIRRVVSAEAAANMVTALKSVIGTNGTAQKARLDYYTVAGKTGTAQKIINKRYVRDKNFSSFIGFFPADNPEICISVVLDEPKRGAFGGETAAPVFARIAERAGNYLAIPPDKMPKTNNLATTHLTRARHN
ncbi:MAG: peptidoglycan D,D-transpeptidase FtsI family protein [Verrucomicrobiales bacterium]